MGGSPERTPTKPTSCSAACDLLGLRPLCCLGVSRPGPNGPRGQRPRGGHHEAGAFPRVGRNGGVPVAGGTASSCFASRWSRCSRWAARYGSSGQQSGRGNGADLQPLPRHGAHRGAQRNPRRSNCSRRSRPTSVRFRRRTSPKERRPIAAQAESTAPDLIGVQEAALWRTGSPSGSFPPPAATTTAYDFVQILTDALRAHGLHYAPSP